MRELVADRLEVGELGEDPLHVAKHFLPGVGHRGEAPAAAYEDAHAELLLEGADLLGDAGLRRVQRRGRVGDVEPAARDLVDVAELLEVHGARPSNNLWLSEYHKEVFFRN